MTLVKKNNPPHRVKKKIVLPYLQRIGKALMFPIAILPFAAIFLRISALIPTGDSSTEFAIIIQSILSTIGNAVFGPVLPVIFAIGISFGLSKDQRGEAAIVGFVVMIMIQLFLSPAQTGLMSGGIDLVDRIYGNVQLSPTGFAPAYGFHELFTNKEANVDKYQAIMVDNVFNGIMVGILVSTIYNHFNGIELPSILGFFSGRRLVPVLGLISGLIFGILWAIIFPWITWCLFFLSDAMGKATGNRYGNAAISGVFVFLNRLLIPFGLHHIPNTIFWFTLGDFAPATGTQPVFGDINIFLNGAVYDPLKHSYNNAGTFQTGFFPFMMFGLPALAFAFYKNAENKEQAKKVASLLLGSSLVAFFTGITEPLEFSFMFIAPMLYLMHSILAGFWALIVGLMGIQLGFGFSAGFIDYVLSIPKSMEIINAKLNGVVINGEAIAPVYSKVEAVFANPGMIIPVGILCGLSYYYGVKIAVKFFNIDTPGRGKNILKDDSENAEIKVDGINTNKYTSSALNIINGVGKENISNLEWCATRLRFTLVDNSKVNEELVKKSMSRGEIKIGSTGYQVIIGPTVEMMGNEINRVLNNWSSFTNINKINQQSSNDSLDIKEKNVEEIKLFPPTKGKVKTLESLNDGVFSEKILGEGFVTTIFDGNVYAPVGGKLVTVFPTKHAYGIETKDGLNVLIHIGIDTVSLDGKGFESMVTQGQEVKEGDLLVKVDKEVLKKHSLISDVICVVTSDSKIKSNKITTKK